MASATIAFPLTEDWGRRTLDCGVTDSKRDREAIDRKAQTSEEK